MAKALKYKVHEDPDGKTIDLTLKVVVIENGFLIKAGGPPFFCADELSLKKAIDDMLTRFTDETNREKKT